MAKAQTVRTPTHKWFTAPGTLAIAIGRLHGQTLYINRLENGRVVEKRVAYAASFDLTGHGKGVSPYDGRRVSIMQGAWRYQFGPDAPLPAFCELHKESV